MKSEEKGNVKIQGVPFRKGFFTVGEDPHLIGTKCKLCNTIFFPPRVICTRCSKEDVMEKIELSRKGKLCSYSIVMQNIPRYESPYVVAYVDLPEGVRVFTHLTDCDPSDLKIDMDVEMVIDFLRKDEDGNNLIGYKFRPISKSS